jgi:hypothetical protein
MRSLILALIGLVVGSLCTAILIKNLNRGTAYPNGVMTVMGAQMGTLDRNMKAPNLTDVSGHALSVGGCRASCPSRAWLGGSYQIRC